MRTKKLASLLLALIWVACLTACGNDADVLHMGVNAVVKKVDTTNKRITVKGTDLDSMLGENCVISSKDIDLIYCNYDNGEIKQILIQDLEIEDSIILNIKESEIRKFASGKEILKVEQLQLGTQRLN